MQHSRFIFRELECSREKQELDYNCKCTKMKLLISVNNLSYIQNPSVIVPLGETLMFLHRTLHFSFHRGFSINSTPFYSKLCVLSGISVQCKLHVTALYLEPVQNFNIQLLGTWYNFRNLFKNVGILFVCICFREPKKFFRNSGTF